MTKIFKASNGKEYEAVIGMEVHAELKTASKMYCRCRSSFGDPPNEHVCPVCMGLPGSLPVVNREAVVLGTRAALALHCAMSDGQFAEFARKHYFYPDLPKGYQITMYAWPLAGEGRLEIWVDDGPRCIGIERAHLEEDTAKLIHEDDDTSSIDYNRAGVPLLEVVGKPELKTAEEAKLFLKELRDILRRNNISDGNMEEGSFRCEANISLREAGSNEFGVRSEIKNLNSFLAVEKALNCEIERHLEMYGRGEKIRPETRGWDEGKGATFHLRFKERADEYRYFPEPDIPDLYMTEDILAEARKGMVTSPFDEKKKLMDKHGLEYHLANTIVNRDGGAALYKDTLEAGADSSETAKWLTGEIYGYLNEEHLEIEQTKITGPLFAEFLKLVDDGVVSGPVAKDLIRDIAKSGGKPSVIVEEKGLKQLSNDDDILPIVRRIVDENPKMVEQYRNGKTKVVKAMIGLVMAATSGKANPVRAGELIEDILKQL